MACALPTQDGLPQDPAVPQLARALDPAAMHEVFAEMLAPHGKALRSCDVERVKYRPGRNATIAYRLSLQDASASGAEAPCVEQHVAVRLCHDDGPRRFRKACARTTHRTPGGPTLTYGPELAMLSWWWPNDARLDAPAVLADDAALRERWLPPLVAAMSAGRGRLQQATLKVAQYVPEQRVCVRAEIGWSEGGRGVQATAYAKASREPGTATAHAQLEALQSSEAWRHGRLHTPRAWLMQPELSWQSAMPGRAWSDLDADQHDWAVPALAGQLAALHTTTVAVAMVMDAKALRQRLADAMVGLEHVLPQCTHDLRHVRRALEAGLERYARLPAVTLHGDLHGRNVLVADDTVSLIDLDGLRRGAAELELGGWIAERLTRELLRGSAPALASCRDDPLVCAYAECSRRPLDLATLGWATAWSLITQRAWRGVVNLKRGRLALAPRLISLAAALADTAATRPVHP